MLPPRATTFLSSLLTRAPALSAATTPGRRTQSNAKELQAADKSLPCANRPHAGGKVVGTSGTPKDEDLKRWRHA